MATEIIDKNCPRCKAAKAADDFYKDRKRQDGLYPLCKECVREDRAKNKDRIAANDRNRGGQARADARTLGLLRFNGKQCPKGHIERWVSNGCCVDCSRHSSAAWRNANPEKNAAIIAEWVKNNFERDRAVRKARSESPEYLERGRAWYAENKDARRETIAVWQANNPDTVRSIKHNYRAKQKAGGKHSGKDISDLRRRQKNKCAHDWCRADLSDGYHVDHIKPISKGGTSDRKNIQLLCPICNHKKSDIDPIEFARRNGRLL